MTAPDLATLRARAQRHQAQLDAHRLYLSTAQVAARLNVTLATIRAVPFEELPWIAVGEGAQRQHRRYHPDDVAAFDALRKARAKGHHRKAG